jgi:hypothetical protein
MNTSRLGPSTAAPPKVVAALSDLSAVCSLMVEFGGHRMRMLEVSVDRAPTDGTDPDQPQCGGNIPPNRRSISPGLPRAAAW